MIAWKFYDASHIADLDFLYSLANKIGGIYVYMHQKVFGMWESYLSGD